MEGGVYYFAALGLWFSFLILLAVLSLILYRIANWVFDRLVQSKYKTVAGIFTSELTSLERWCGYEYPIIEDVCKHLRQGICDGVRGDTSKFRDELRKKYKPERWEENDR